MTIARGDGTMQTVGMPIPRLRRETAGLLVVDMQQRLLPAVHDGPELVRRVAQLIDGARLLDIPISVTEQYRKGLGDTVPEIASRLPAGAARHDKLKFSACIDPVEAEFKSRGVCSVLVCGVEAHVCVLQSCLDLLERGYGVFLAVDAISSRRTPDKEAAIHRLAGAGGITTTVESALFELMREASGDMFKRMLQIVK